MSILFQIISHLGYYRLLSIASLCDLRNCSQPGSCVKEFSRQEYWSGLPFPAPGDLPDPGIELASLASPALAGRLFALAPPGKPSLTLSAVYSRSLSIIYFIYI